MPTIQIKAQPGFISQPTQVQAEGTWFDGNLMRWKLGLLEKMGGWQRLLADPFAHFIRRLHAWLDLDNHKNALVGTDLGLEIVVQDTAYPLGIEVPVVGGTGGATFDVAMGSTIVTVVSPAGVESGQTLVTRLPISIGGRLIATGTILEVREKTTTGFTFDMPLAATVAEGPVPGIRLFTNTTGNKITVTFKGHGLAVNDTFSVAQTTAIFNPTDGTMFNLTPGTEFKALTVPTVDTFTFDLGVSGHGSGSGLAVYEGEILDSVVPTASRLSVPISASAPFSLADPKKSTWFLDNMGQDGLALATGSPLLVYHPPIDDGPFISVVASAPLVSNGMFVAMPQAQVILFGTEPIIGSGVIDPLLIRFSDVGTFDTYQATVSNQAGSYRLSRGSRIVGGIQSPQTTLIFTDLDVWSMSYIGPPLVYGFTIVGTGCGLVAPHAVTVLGRLTAWQTKSGIWAYSSSGVQQLPCAVHDFIFNDVDDANINKCHAGSNSIGNEMMFWFPSRSDPFYVGPEGPPPLETDEPLPLPPAPPPPVIPPNVNLLTVPDNFRKWERVNAIVKTHGKGPDGVATGYSLATTADDGPHQLFLQVDQVNPRETYTFSVYAKKTTSWNIALDFWMSDLTEVWTLFDLNTQAILETGATSLAAEFVSASVTTDDVATGAGGNDWYRFNLTVKIDDSPNIWVGFWAVAGQTWTFPGDGGATFIQIWHAVLNTGEVEVPPDEEDNGGGGTFHRTEGTTLSNECSRYVKFNTLESLWDKGELMRTAWINVNVFGGPLGGDQNFRIQQHERGYDDDDQPMRGVFAETGFSNANQGEQIVMLDECQPDFKWFGNNGSIHMSFKALAYPQDEERAQVYGPYSITPTTRWFTPRVRGKYIAVRYDWQAIRGFSARVGASRFRAKLTGRQP